MLFSVARLIALLSAVNAMSIGVGDKFPSSAAKLCGTTGKKSVVFFYGADDAPSCEKQIMGMDAALPEFQSMGVNVVGGMRVGVILNSDMPNQGRRSSPVSTVRSPAQCATRPARSSRMTRTV